MTTRKVRKIVISTAFGQFLCQFISSKGERGYTVTSLDAPGFIAYGETFAEAKKLAKSGLEFHCECLAFERLKKEQSSKVARHGGRSFAVAGSRSG